MPLPRFPVRRRVRLRALCTCAGALAAVATPAQAATPVVAVLDSGVDVAHPALRGHLWRDLGEVAGNRRDDDLDGVVDDVHGADIVGGDGAAADPTGHGTHVAGLVVRGPGRNGRPTGARLMAVRVLRPAGMNTLVDLAAGIDYAVAHDAQVINLSLSGYDDGPVLSGALLRASRAGAIVVAAAGNDREDLDVDPVYPAAYRLPGMIVVAAAKGNRLASFTGFGGATVDLAAPGARVLSTLPRGGWGRMTGTSQATAAVSRAAGRLLARHPGLTNVEVRRAIVRSARPAPSLHGRVISGGVLDERRAVRRAGRILARR